MTVRRSQSLLIRLGRSTPYNDTSFALRLEAFRIFEINVPRTSAISFRSPGFLYHCFFFFLSVTAQRRSRESSGERYSCN